MKQYVVAKPLELGGRWRRIGETVSEAEIRPEGLGWLMRMEYLVRLEGEKGLEDFGLSLLPAETDADGLGKKVKELGNFTLSEDGNLSGTLNYVTGYTGFNNAKPEEQEGYFFPFGFTRPEGYDKAHMMVKGGGGTSTEPTAQNVIFLGKTAEDVKGRSLVLTLNRIDGENPDNIQSAVKEYPMAGLTAAERQRSRKKG